MRWAPRKALTQAISLRAHQARDRAKRWRQRKADGPPRRASWPACSLETGSEIGAAGDEITVGIVPGRQLDDMRADVSTLEAPGELVGSRLAGLVFVLGEIDGTAGTAAAQSAWGLY
jgi:hypothetical protein